MMIRIPEIQAGAMVHKVALDLPVAPAVAAETAYRIRSPTGALAVELPAAEVIFKA